MRTLLDTLAKNPRHKESINFLDINNVAPFPGSTYSFILKLEMRLHYRLELESNIITIEVNA
jgi:hypothetical protein